MAPIGIFLLFFVWFFNACFVSALIAFFVSVFVCFLCLFWFIWLGGSVFSKKKKNCSDRVYLIGYSAGGDGVYKLAPRLASLFAGCCMMAGHPNGEPVLGLRNLPFSIQCGQHDASYNRNTVCKEYAQKLDDLQRAGKEKKKITTFELL